MKTSIIDVPRKPSQADLFGIQVYQDALIKYIRLTDTPITIALQGEWGSGKTSLMNLLRHNLCDTEGAPYFPIWINTWQFSLMKTPQQDIISILEAIINQIGMLNPSEHKWEESKKKIGGLFKKMATIGTKVAAGVVGVEGDVVDDIFQNGNEQSSDIAQLKDEIAQLIDAALAHRQDKQGLTFYIDDLDRIDPPVAVEIPELLKKVYKFNSDTNNYRYNGKVYGKKTELVFDVVNDYVAAHPGITHNELKAAFTVKKNMDVVFMDFERYLAIKAEKGKLDFFGSNRTMEDTIRLADKNILICSNWPTTSHGKPAEFSRFLDILRNVHKINVEQC